MRTSTGPKRDGNQMHIPELGPVCHHNEPTVLKVLNGRSMYVCNRYPMHHCRMCCPTDVMLLDDQLARPQNNNPSLFGSPMGPDSFESSRDIKTCIEQEPKPANESEEKTSSLKSKGESTPGARQNTSSFTPSLPPAPSKPQYSHGGSVTSRDVSFGGAARSLAPLFNNFAPAVARATQLGGRYAMLRPHANHIVRLQRQLSQPLDSSIPPLNTVATTTTTTTVFHPCDNNNNDDDDDDEQQCASIPPTMNESETDTNTKPVAKNDTKIKNTNRKRPYPTTTSNSIGGLSVQTVSRGRERRPVSWKTKRMMM